MADFAPVPMNEYEKSRTREWLRRKRDGRSQHELAAAITEATGWKITRDRYSKYESGSLPIGPTVLAHFQDYWQDAPDLTEKPAPLSLEERAVVAAERQATAAEQHVVLLAAILDRMTTPSGQPGVAPEMVRDAQEWAAQVLAQSPLPRHAPVARSE